MMIARTNQFNKVSYSKEQKVKFTKNKMIIKRN